MKLVRWHRNLIETGPDKPLDYCAYVLFFPLALLYGAVSRIRAIFYMKEWFARYRASVPVISVGNLSAGGTGKTPICDYLLDSMLAKGRKVALISRGYGRQSNESLVVVSEGKGPIVKPEAGGDEPVLLARRNPNAIVVVSPDRRRGIASAIDDYGVELIILDDGFQHLKVKRDLDIVLLDAKKPFGNGFPLPFGPLREFPSAIDRADLIVMTRSAGEKPLQVGDKTVLLLEYELAEFAIDGEGDKINLDSLTSRRIGAFAGIADPSSFFESLRTSGIEPVETLELDDHADYNATVMENLRTLAGKCDILLTTEKDFVKLGSFDGPARCYAVPLKIRFTEQDQNMLEHVEVALDKFREKMMISDELISILACPECKKEIRYDRDHNRIVCEACHLAYPARDGIPVMLIDEAEKLYPEQ